MAGVPDGRDPDGWQILLASRLASRWQLPLALRLASTRHLLDSFRGSALSRWFARCKNRNSDIFATFFRLGTLFAPVKRKRVVARLITCAFTPIFEIEDNVTVPNRKKVAIWTDFLFFGIPEWRILEWGIPEWPHGSNCAETHFCQYCLSPSFVFLGLVPLYASTSYSYSEVSMISRLSTLMQASLPSSSMYQQ